MLSDDDKREILEDAHNKERGQVFAKARAAVLDKKLTGPQYVQFVQGVQHMFSKVKSYKKIEGLMFKL